MTFGQHFYFASSSYTSINYSILEEKVAARIDDSSILHLVHDAITTETIPVNIPAPKSSNSSVGIPEGLSISNILADIYLSDLEKKIVEKYENLAYFRYVDDILILCQESDAKAIKEYTISLLKDYYKLDNHEEKTICAELSSKVPYLGYVFSDKKVSIRDESSNRIEKVIEELFQLRKRKKISQQVFEWRLNVKIAGCIHEKKKYGWMFYYSQITDLEVLYHLDWFVDKLFSRFGFSPPKDLKRFVHVYHEITKNLKKSTYLIKTENYKRTDKEKVIFTVLGIRYGEDVDEKVINDQFLRLCVDYGEDRVIFAKNRIPAGIVPTVDMIRSYLDEPENAAVIRFQNDVYITQTNLAYYDEKCGVAAR